MTRALHYPSIEFQDTEALKRSLLVWDGIHRIVPSGYTPQDDAEVRGCTGRCCRQPGSRFGRETQSGPSLPRFLLSQEQPDHAAGMACWMLVPLVHPDQPGQDRSKTFAVV